MTAHLLSRTTSSRDRDRPALSFLDGMALPLARAHEFCGDARRTLAALVAARTEGPVFWISPSWQPERLNPEAAAHLFDPGRLVFLEPQRAEDLLWCLEEVLRAGGPDGPQSFGGTTDSVGCAFAPCVFQGQQSGI